MGNRIQIRSGSTVPSADNLLNFELGYCTTDGKLYFNNGDSIENILSLTNIEDGFTLNNGAYISSFLSDNETKVNLIGRFGFNHVWIGSTTDTNQGDAYICVGEGSEGDARGNLYVVRTHLTLSDSQDRDNRYIVYDNYSIRNGFTLNNNAEIKSPLSDGTEARLIKRDGTTNNNLWIGSRNVANQGHMYLSVGRGTGLTKVGKVYVARANEYEETSNNDLYMVYDEKTIGDGFTLNNEAHIKAKLENGTSETVLYRTSNNNTWLGGSPEANTTIGKVVLSVGKGKDGTGDENAYIHRRSKGTASSVNELIYDETSIGGGFILNNNNSIKAYLADGTTTCQIAYRSRNNYLWLGGSDSTTTSDAMGRVYLVVGKGINETAADNYAYVYRRDNTNGNEASKILDYGYIAKNVWTGSCAVGATFTITNFADYRYFIINLNGSNTSLLVMRRGNYLRGGCVYANSGITFETVRCNGNSSGVFTYTEGRSYTLTTSGATANWGTSASPAPNIINIWGVL